MIFDLSSSGTMICDLTSPPFFKSLIYAAYWKVKTKTKDRILCRWETENSQVPAILFIPDYILFYQGKSLDCALVAF